MYGILLLHRECIYYMNFVEFVTAIHMMIGLKTDSWVYTANRALNPRKRVKFGTKNEIQGKILYFDLM